jgi:hypothetical protein
MAYLRNLILPKAYCAAEVMMHRTRSTSLLFLSIVALFLAACAGIAGTEPEIKPVSEVKVPHAAVAAEQHVPEVAPSQDAPAEIEGPMGQLFAHEQAFIELFERTSGSVVHVGVDDGQGSGFVYDDAGHIVTNNHVIAQARSIVISFADGSQLDATVVGTDPGSDLAVLKVEAGPGELKGGWTGCSLAQRLQAAADTIFQILSRPTRPSTQVIPAARCSICEAM